MLFYISSSNNPYFNIATEEYLLKQTDNEYFLIYRNQPSVIIGKHQNTFAEINHKFTKINNIKIIRRLTGGGAVYHDLGNINFAFITNCNSGNHVDFAKYISPINNALNFYGINSEIDQRNNLIINNLKISGNAGHVYKNRTLHHGTLLFSSNLDWLENSLNSNALIYYDNSVKSVRSRVTNISEHNNQNIDIDQFTNFLFLCLKNIFNGTILEKLQVSDIEKINELVIQKYSTWVWNFGYSPQFVITKSIDIEKHLLFIKIIVNKGIINEFSITKNNILCYNEVAEKLKDVKLNETEIKQAINKVESDLWQFIDLEDFTDKIFQD